jgi:hypothetical protein
MEKFLLLLDLVAFAGVSAIFFSMAVAGKRAARRTNVSLGFPPGTTSRDRSEDATVGNASMTDPPLHHSTSGPGLVRKRRSRELKERRRWLRNERRRQ